MSVKKNTELGPEDLLAKAKKDALRLLSFRPRSTQELKSRLQRKSYEKAVIEDVVEYFTKQGFLDDEKFAKLYAISRIQSRPSGKRQIAFDLKNKGLSPALVSRALESIEDFDEKQIALDLAVKRHKNMNGVPEQTAKTRLFGFLSRRGFSSEAVFYALSKLFKRVDDLQ